MLCSHVTHLCVLSVINKILCILVITRLTPGVLLPPDHRHEFKILIHITLLDMITITVIDHGMSLSVPSRER
jgi:hypothetical protein